MSTLDKKDELYVDNYYDYHGQLHDRSNFRNENSTGKIDEQISGMVFQITLTILLRVGFLLVQIGSVPVGNVNLILLQNIVDFCTVTAVSILIGFVVAFGGDMAGIIGEGIWIGDSKANVNEALVGWGAAVTASAICSCGIVGRMHAVGYLLTAILISGIIQPLLIHWAWTPQGWMADNSLTGRPVSFKDYASGGTIHVIGGLAGFLGCATLGRRILRLRDIDDASLPADSPGSVFAGYLLIFLGLQGLSLPLLEYGSSKVPARNLSHILVNNLLAASCSSLFIVALHFALNREAFNYWTVMRCVQGTISGVVAVAAGLDVYSPLIVVGISCASGLVFYLVSRRVYRSALEDYCNIVATHLVSALFGSFLAPLCGKPRGNEAVNHAMVLDVAWQVICILALLVLVILTMGPLFVLLDSCGFLRNRSEFVNHLRATVALERGPPRSYMQRLFFPGVESLYLQPGSVPKSGNGPQIMSPRLWRYQQEITRLEETRPKQQGGNIISDTPEKVAHPSSPIDLVIPKIKKSRQIYTLPKIILPGHSDVGGTGESVEDGRDITEKDFLAKSNVILTESTIHEEALGLIGDHGECISGKKFCTRLHRTSKVLSLHSGQADKRLDCLREEHPREDEEIRTSDFTVKVLMEPREKLYNASSESEEEKVVEKFSVTKERVKNLDKILR